MHHIRIYTDGGSRNNPGEAGAGGVIYDGETKVAEIAQYLGIQTNNWAEYEACFLALTKARELGLHERDIVSYLDSKLVVEQLSGNWKIKEPTLKPQAAKIHELLADFTNVKFEHVRREYNKEADQLANDAMDRGV